MRQIAVISPFEKCPLCGYLLEGLPDEHWCPECGLAYDPHSICIKGCSKWKKWIDIVSVPILLSGFLFWLYQPSILLLALFATVFPLFSIIKSLRENRYCQKFVINREGVTVVMAGRNNQCFAWDEIDVARSKEGCLKIYKDGPVIFRATQCGGLQASVAAEHHINEKKKVYADCCLHAQGDA